MTTRPHIVIIGGGFGGLSAAKALKRTNADVTVIDRTNHHLFQPLLYQVATASLSSTDVTAPIRQILNRLENTEVMLGEVNAIDVAERIVSIDNGEHQLHYDYLIVASGSRHAYFGHDEWEPLAPGLKNLEDASEIRRRFLLAFELAEKEADEAKRGALLTFVIVGGGPTGVELSGAISTMAKKGLYRDFRRIDTRRARVILVEGGKRILPSFPESLAETARRSLENLGVSILTESIVTKIESDAVSIGDEQISTNTVFWAAGNAASPLGRMLGAPLDRSGRVVVNPDLSIPGHPEVFVVGDLALVTRKDGRPVPGVSPAAIQEGRAAANSIRRLLWRQETKPFSYFNKGDLAVIGRSRAIADFGRVRFSGRIAWLLWLFVHIMYLVGFRNRISVFIQWAYSYITYGGGARVITRAETQKQTASD